MEHLFPDDYKNNFSFKLQNVLFYALSDDIAGAREKLIIPENSSFDIVFPGEGNIGSPGR